MDMFFIKNFNNASCLFRLTSDGIDTDTRIILPTASFVTCYLDQDLATNTTHRSLMVYSVVLCGPRIKFIICLKIIVTYKLNMIMHFCLK